MSNPLNPTGGSSLGFVMDPNSLSVSEVLPHMVQFINLQQARIRELENERICLMEKYHLGSQEREDRLLELAERISVFQNENEKLKLESQKLQLELEYKGKELDTKVQLIAELNSVISSSKKIVEEKETQNQSLTKQNETLSSENETLREKNKGLVDEVTRYAHIIQEMRPHLEHPPTGQTGILGFFTTMFGD